MSVAWVAVGTAVLGTAVSANSASKARKSQEQAAREANAASQEESANAIAENRRQYDLSRADMTPAVQRGNLAGNRLQELMGLGTNTGASGFGSLTQRFTGADLTNEPGYQFGLQQGQRGLDNSAAARGGYYSGAQLKAASRYNSDYANTKFNDAYNRYNTDQSNLFNRYSGIAGTGQQAISQLSQQGAQMAQNNGQIGMANANNIGNNIIGAGNARASSYLYQGNALQNALNQGVSTWKNNYNSPSSSNIGSNADYANNDYLTS